VDSGGAMRGIFTLRISIEGRKIEADTPRPGDV